ncbi:MAG TPA: hypothetical protein VGL46_12605 [Pseudonocardiaceae bacterium]|jgi:hypothetical protein
MSDRTKSDPTAARKRRSWDSLSFIERHTVEVLLEHARFGREAAEIGGTDRDFTLWLFDASVAFADRTQEFPQDLTDGAWRGWYAKGLTPWGAALVALHRKPMVRIAGEKLVCPVCETGEVFERDVAVRYNQLQADDGYVYGTAESADFVHDQYVCDHCESGVRLPRRVEDYS